MNLVENLNQFIQTAEYLKLNGKLNDSLQYYLKALRILTPDDTQIELAIAFIGLEGKSKVESPNTDKLDSFLRSKIVEIYRELGDFQNAYYHASIALFLDRQVWGTQSNNTSASYHDLGLVEFQRKNFSDSEKWFNKSNDIDNYLLRTNLSDPIKNNINFRKLIRASQFGKRGFLLKAAKESLKILPHIEKGFPDIIKTSDALNSCAQDLQNLGEHHKAKEILKRAIHLHIESNLENHPQMGRLYSNMCILLHELWEFEGSAIYEAKSLNFDQTSFDILRKENNILEEDRKRIKQLINRIKSVPSFNNDIFISFNTHDEDIVRELNENLKSFGMRTLIFWEIEGWKKKRSYDEIIRSISKHLLLSKIVVMVASGTSLASRYVFEEVNFCINNSIPLLIWFPEGVRLCPTASSTKTDLSEIHLLNFESKIFRPGVYSLFGYGLQEENIEVISKSIISWINKINNLKQQQYTLTNETLLIPTRLKPIFVDKNNM